ncbi:hypothetical protein [Glycomyces algeriensis]|uniref:Protein ImuA n=1 Tax=Glycomyces algeriensis TaxID=256037 RepID=A0A9W6LH92_9ACTN|nr:hypothetical protein [Glycomyces algeriensis]MDA1364647.1 hypothetical protein [Glycomyces algeriensis]MDR7350684.1 hypothetical protein [Glycomyces algeriensis]GLI43393.1 hypothetical protein GALLR39Z86_32430 [Glycomyces algeriensis]
MATSVAAALAAELGLRTAAELRPAAEARPGREARLAGGPPPDTGALATAPHSVVSAAVAEPRPEAAPDASRVILPVTPDISALLPHGGLATVTAIMASRRGATSLLWRLLAGPTGSGAWCALVGMPRVYPLAATAAGVDLGRVALVDPGPLVVEAAGTLAEGVAAVVVPSEGLTPTQTRRLAARARKSGTAIIWWETRPVSGADARLEVARARWKGLRPNAGRRWGAGRLDACELEVAAHWRTGGTRNARIWPYGGEAEAAGENRSAHGNVIDLHSRSAMDRGAAEANRSRPRANGAQRGRFGERIAIADRQADLADSGGLPPSPSPTHPTTTLPTATSTGRAPVECGDDPGASGKFRIRSGAADASAGHSSVAGGYDSSAPSVTQVSPSVMVPLLDRTRLRIDSSAASGGEVVPLRPAGGDLP